MNALLLALFLAADPPAGALAAAPSRDEIGGSVAAFGQLSDRFGVQGRVNFNLVYGHQFGGTGIEGRVLVGFLGARNWFDRGLNHASAALQLVFHGRVGSIDLTAGMGLIGSAGEEFYFYHPDSPWSAKVAPIRSSNFSAQAGGQALLGWAVEVLQHLLVRVHLRVDLMLWREPKNYQPFVVPTMWLELGVASWR